jgi:lysophospholipase L1-like esterase
LPDQHEEDGLMERFEARGTSRFSARDSVMAILITAVLLFVFFGGTVRKQGQEQKQGVQRSAILAVGKPAGYLADKLPLDDAARGATDWLSPDEDLGGKGGFASVRTGAEGGGAAALTVTPDAFDPAVLGAKPAARRPLKTLLVTGDSMAQPLDVELARKLAGGSVKVIRDPHVGTGISNPLIADWGELSTSQVAKKHPDAIVVFIGANEGYPMPGPAGKDVNCCGVGWAAIYATRVRTMMNTYRQAGRARVYWITIPTPRENARQPIARTVNASVSVAAQPWRSQVRLVDTVPVFTPGARYRAAMNVDGREQIVRESDGIHLNDTGSRLLAGIVLTAIDRDFTR